MDRKQMKIAGIVCLVICAICIFVAVERYRANAGNVRGMNALRQSSPFRGMVGGMKPGTPGSTKYALFFAVLSGIAGAILLMKSTKQSPQDETLKSADKSTP